MTDGDVIGLSRSIPGAQLCSVASGHVPFWECPAQTLALVDGLLASTERP